MSIIIRRCKAQMRWQIEIETASKTLIAPCAIGPNGVSPKKREGDGMTPAGVFALLQVWARADRVSAPETSLPVRHIGPDDGWCDDPTHKLYNRHVTRPFAASHELLWREDHAYDLCVVLDYNLAPPVSGKGSAIFLHLAKPDAQGQGFAPTEGCVAVSQDILRKILALAPPLSLEICP